MPLQAFHVVGLLEATIRNGRIAGSFTHMVVRPGLRPKTYEEIELTINDETMVADPAQLELLNTRQDSNILTPARLGAGCFTWAVPSMFDWGGKRAWNNLASIYGDLGEECLMTIMREVMAPDPLKLDSQNGIPGHMDIAGGAIEELAELGLYLEEDGWVPFEILPPNHGYTETAVIAQLKEWGRLMPNFQKTDPIDVRLKEGPDTLNGMSGYYSSGVDDGCFDWNFDADILGDGRLFRLRDTEHMPKDPKAEEIEWIPIGRFPHVICRTEKRGVVAFPFNGKYFGYTAPTIITADTPNLSFKTRVALRLKGWI